MKAAEFIEKVKAGEIDVIEHTKKAIEECRKIDKEYHYFTVICEELAMEQAKKIQEDPKGRLAGLPVTLKDAICVKGVETRSSSAILGGYKPMFNSTVARRIMDEGGIIIGKTNQDEFGFGGFSTNVGKGFEMPLNPFNKDYVTGGSSGGAAGFAQKATFPHIALGESTGGSIADPASFCGVYGLCPTYGRVSRYGLLDYGNSLDKIGPIAKCAEDIALMLSVISGYEPRESTSLDEPVDDYEKNIGKGVKGMKVGIIDFGVGDDIDKDVKDATLEAIKKLEAQGAECKKVSLPLAKKYGIPAYFLLSTCEASTNLAKYCGMRYGATEALEGNFNEYFAKVRSKYFGDEAKRRVMLGTFTRMAGTRDAYYMKAAKIRTKIIEEYKRAFKKFDVLICPTTPFPAKRFDELEKMTPLQHYMVDMLLVSPNLAGVPHMSVPAGMADGLPIGVLLTADHLQEKNIMQAAAALR